MLRGRTPGRSAPRRGPAGSDSRTFNVRASNSTISLLSSRLTKMCPFSSETASSGTPPSSRLPTAFIASGSIAVVSLLPWLKVKTLPDDRLEVDDVRAAVGLDLAQGLERLRVEDRHAGVAAVAGEAPIQVGDEGDAVHPGRVGDLADDGLGVEVNHDRRDCPGSRRACGYGLDLEEVPAALAADRDLADLLVRGHRVLAPTGADERQKQRRNQRMNGAVPLLSLPPDCWTLRSMSWMHVRRRSAHSLTVSDEPPSQQPYITFPRRPAGHFFHEMMMKKTRCSRSIQINI